MQETISDRNETSYVEMYWLAMFKSFFPEHVGQCCWLGAGKNIPLDYITPLLVPLRASLGSMENGKGDGGSGWADTWT